MTLFLQFLFSGIMLGGIYGLIAVGIVLIVKGTKVFNFAHGDLAALGAYLFWGLLVQAQLNIGLSVVVMLIFAAILAVFLERFILRPMIGQPLLSTIMVTIGVGQIFAGIITLLWPGPGRTFPHIMPSGTFHVGPIALSLEALISFAICIVALICFYFLFQHTNIGLAMRGTAEDHQLAQSGGIQVTRIFAVCWFIGIMLASMGGILIGNLHQVDRPAVAHFVLKSFAVVIFGGLESIVGALIAGIFVGMLEILGAGYLDPLVGGGLGEIIPFVVLLTILLIKPYGLFGYKRIERV
ncbi:MAG: branched-chain amino acid ABC transporter permease [Thermodesulfobacteriota bacterium]|nr:branched-chain amino acid ABC transporter permease [Thermodesulfobacteriota bacterium]